MSAIETITEAPDLNGKWIEVFEGGTQTDSEGRTDIFDENKLDYTVKSYNPTHHEAPLCIGHPEHNTPAYGWVEAVKREGKKLLAKCKQIPPEISNAIHSGFWKKRSISFYPDGKLRHIGFLGAQPPAVKGLVDIKFEEKEEKYVSFSQPNNIAKTISESPPNDFSSIDNLNPFGTSDSLKVDKPDKVTKENKDLWPENTDNLSETPGEIRHKVRSPDMFDVMTRMTELKGNPGIFVHLGKLPGDDTETSHAVTFKKDQGWTMEKAKLWIEGHKNKYPLHGNAANFTEANPWEETENQVRHRVENPDNFDPDTYRTKDIGKGISLVLGKLKNKNSKDDPMVTQSVRFDMNDKKEKWTSKKAKEWIKKLPTFNESNFAETMTHTETHCADIKKYCDTINNTCNNSRMSKEDISTIETCCATITQYCDLMDSMGIAKCCDIIRDSNKAIRSLCNDYPDGNIIKSCCEAIDKSCDKLRGNDYYFNEGIKPAKEAEKDINPEKDYKEVKNMKTKKKMEEETPEEETPETPADEVKEEAAKGKEAAKPPKKAKAFSEYSEEEIAELEQKVARITFLEQKAEEERKAREFAEVELKKIATAKRLAEYRSFCEKDLAGQLLPADHSDVIDIMDFCETHGSYNFAEGGEQKTVDKFKALLKKYIPEHKLFSEVATKEKANQQFATVVKGKNTKIRKFAETRNMTVDREQEIDDQRTRQYMSQHPGVDYEQALKAIKEV